MKHATGIDCCRTHIYFAPISRTYGLFLKKVVYFFIIIFEYNSSECYVLQLALIELNVANYF